jgi:YgiT-type zinc finger domain-containing protein
MQQCSICKEGTLSAGFKTIFFESKNSIVIIKDAAGLVCNQCGEIYLNDETTTEVYNKVNDAIKKGAELEIIKMPKAA